MLNVYLMFFNLKLKLKLSNYYSVDNDLVNNRYLL